MELRSGQHRSQAFTLLLTAQVAEVCFLQRLGELGDISGIEGA